MKSFISQCRSVPTHTSHKKAIIKITKKKKKLKPTVKKNSVEKRHLFGNSILTQTQFKLNSNSTQARNSINSRSLEFEAYPASNNVALKSREHLTLQWKSPYNNLWCSSIGNRKIRMLQVSHKCINNRGKKNSCYIFLLLVRSCFLHDGSLIISFVISYMKIDHSKLETIQGI